MSRSIPFSSRAYLARAALRIKKLMFWALSKSTEYIRLPIVSNTVSALSAAYFLSYQFLQDDWSIFKNFPSQHIFIIKVLITLTVSLGIIRGITDSYLQKHFFKYIDLLQNYIRMNGNIVSIKHKRFKEKTRKISNPHNVFSTITHPSDQINAIIEQVQEFLINNFDLRNSDDLRITIIEKLGEVDWEYTFDNHQSWVANTSEALDLLTSPSAASLARDSGEPIYHHDKRIAAAKGKYKMSERDAQKGTGSVYCYPVSVNFPNNEFVGIISLVTYNSKMLSSGFNESETERVKTILKEICRRLELELTLKAIKDWSERAQNTEVS